MEGRPAKSRFDPIVTPLANGRNLRILAIVSRLPSYRDRRRAGIRPTATSTFAISNVRFTSTRDVALCLKCAISGHSDDGPNGRQVLAATAKSMRKLLKKQGVTPKCW